MEHPDEASTVVHNLDLAGTSSTSVKAFLYGQMKVDRRHCLRTGSNLQYLRAIFLTRCVHPNLARPEFSLGLRVSAGADDSLQTARLPVYSTLI